MIYSMETFWTKDEDDWFSSVQTKHSETVIYKLILSQNFCGWKHSIPTKISETWLIPTSYKSNTTPFWNLQHFPWHLTSYHLEILQEK